MQISLRREIIIVGIVFLCFVVGWIILDNTSYFSYFYGDKAEATTNTIALTLTITETLTFTVTSGSTIAFGSVSGDSIQREHETTFSMLTNSADGYRVDAGRDRVTATFVSDGGSTFQTPSISDTGTAGARSFNWYTELWSFGLAISGEFKGVWDKRVLGSGFGGRG